MHRDFRGQIERRKQGDAVESLLDSRLGELAVTACGRGKIDKNGAGPHGLDSGAANESGSRPAGHLRRCDDYVRVSGGAGNEIASAVESFFRQFGSIAPAAFRADAAKIDVEELCSQRANLFPSGGADIVGLDDSSEAARGGNGLQPGDACADDEHASRRNGSRGGHEHGKKAGQAIGGGDDSLVTGDGRHGRERVHGLRATDAGHQFHAEECCRPGNGGGERLWSFERLEEGDDDSTRLEQTLIGWIGSIDQREQIGGGKNRGPIGGDSCSGIRVSLIGCACGPACSRLDGDRDSLGQQRFKTLRQKGDARFAGGGFMQDA